VGAGGHIPSVIEAIDAALRLASSAPPSEKREAFVRRAVSLRLTVESWQIQPPVGNEREQLFSQLVALHAEADRLANANTESRSGAESDERARSDEVGAHERPTTPPPFDIEAFARKASTRTTTVPPSEPPTQRMAVADPMSPGLSDDIPVTIDDEMDEVFADRGLAKSVAPGPSAESTAESTSRPSGSAAGAAARSESGSAAGSATAAGAGSTSGSAATSVPDSTSASTSDSTAESSGHSGRTPAPDAAPVLTQRTIDDPVAEMVDCYSLGDYAGAIAVADLILEEEPHHLLARECRTNAQNALEGIYATRLGSFDRTPFVALAAAQIDGLAIDHRAGFLLSLVDGSSPIESILDVSGMPRLDALRILNELVHRGVIAFR
jgi:hypothetical protein